VKKTVISLFFLVVSMMFCQCFGNKTQKNSNVIAFNVVAGNDTTVALSDIVPNDSGSLIVAVNTEGLGAVNTVVVDSNRRNNDKDVVKHELSLEELKVRIFELEADKRRLSDSYGLLEKDNKITNNENENCKKDNEKLMQKIVKIEQDNNDLLNRKIDCDRQNKECEQKVTTIIESYKNAKSFDEWIKNSTKHTISRDVVFFESGSKEEKNLKDLQTYFIAKEMLEQQYNTAVVNRLVVVQKGLSGVNQKSDLVEDLKEDINSYKECGELLKKAITELIDLDKKISAARVPEAQEIKFAKIAVIMGNYMSKNYNYVKFPYLAGIISKIMQRKGINADADIEDLQKKLQ